MELRPRRPAAGERQRLSWSRREVWGDRLSLLTICVILSPCSIACSGPTPSARAIYSNHLNSVEAILTRGGVTLDRAISNDGRGAIRIDASEPTAVRLAEVRPEGAEAVLFVYRGHLRAANLKGRGYLEMRCDIPGKGEFLSRALEAAVTGTTGWVKQETAFFVVRGQRAQTVKLNVVVEGVGVVWIDNIVLVEATR